MVYPPDLHASCTKDAVLCQLGFQEVLTETGWDRKAKGHNVQKTECYVCLCVGIIVNCVSVIRRMSVIFIFCL